MLNPTTNDPVSMGNVDSSYQAAGVVVLTAALAGRKYVAGGFCKSTAFALEALQQNNAAAEWHQAGDAYLSSAKKNFWNDAKVALLAGAAVGVTLYAKDNFVFDSPETPEPAPAGQQPVPAPAGQQPVPAPAGQQPAPAPAGQQPAPAPAGQQPVPAPAGQKPAPAPAGQQPAPAPAGQQPAPAPAGQKPAPAPAGQQPAPAPAGQKPAPAPAGQKPAPAPAGQQPVPAPAGQQPAPAPQPPVAQGGVMWENCQKVSVCKEYVGPFYENYAHPLYKAANDVARDAVISVAGTVHEFAMDHPLVSGAIGFGTYKFATRGSAAADRAADRAAIAQLENQALGLAGLTKAGFDAAIGDTVRRLDGITAQLGGFATTDNLATFTASVQTQLGGFATQLGGFASSQDLIALVGEVQGLANSIAQQPAANPQ